MKTRRALALLASVAIVVGVAGDVWSRPALDVSEYDVAGVHDQLGPYRGTAKITVEDEQCDVKIEVACATAKGEKFGWSGHGKYNMGDLKITIDVPTTGIADALGGPSSAGMRGVAAYVIQSDKQLSGYWAIMHTQRAGSKPKPRAGGSETLTLRKGRPILSAPPRLPPPRLPDDALPVPIVTQPDDYSCGDSSLQACLYYYRVWDGDLRKMYKPLGTTSAVGTDEDPIAAFARSRGIGATFRRGPSVTLDDLRASIKARDPVIVLIQAWRVKPDTDWKTDLDDGHYVVVIGLDANYVYFMDPSAHFGYAYIPIPEFLDRWHHVDDVGSSHKSQRFEHGAIFLHGNANAAARGSLVRIE